MEDTAPPQAAVPLRALVARLHAPGDLRIETLPVPRPGPGEVLLRVLAATTCGTDLKAYRRGHPVMLGAYPAAFGHECAGEVVAVGAGVTGWQPAMGAVTANSAPCGQCFYCARQQPSQCERLRFWNGAFAEYALIPEPIVTRNLHAIPIGLDPAAASMAEPLACALHGVEAARVTAHHCVIIIGDGPMALMLLAAARLRGATVLVLGHHEARLAQARRWGAQRTLSTAGDGALAARAVEEALAACNEGRGADVVFEAVGRADTWQLALTLSRPGGTINLFGGRPRGDAFTMDAFALHYEERTVLGTFHHTPATFATAVDAITSGAVPTGDLLTGTVPLAGLANVFARLERGEGIKYAVRPAPVATRAPARGKNG